MGNSSVCEHHQADVSSTRALRPEYECPRSGSASTLIGLISRCPLPFALYQVDPVPFFGESVMFKAHYVGWIVVSRFFFFFFFFSLSCGVDRHIRDNAVPGPGRSTRLVHPRHRPSLLLSVSQIPVLILAHLPLLHFDMNCLVRILYDCCIHHVILVDISPSWVLHEPKVVLHLPFCRELSV